MSESIQVGILGSFWGMQTTGSGQYTQRLYEELLLDGDVRVRPFVSRRVSATERPDHASALRGPKFLGANVEKIWNEQIAFPRACRKSNLDVMHVPYWAPPFFHRLPVVVTVHDIIPALLSEYRGSLAVRLYTRLVGAACRRADVVLTDSMASAEDIVRVLRVPRERIRVVYLAASEMFKPASEQVLAELADRLQLPDRYLLYLGGFDCRKNVLLLLDAFAELARTDVDIELVVAGKLPAVDTLFHPDPREYARKKGMERVRFLGWVDEEDKPALYSGALGFCFPSMYEGFGLPVLESLSCGTPAIVGENSSLPEVSGPGGLAVPLDVDSLAEAMQQLVTDTALRATLAAAGLKHTSEFNWRYTAEQTVEAYRLALGLRE